MRSFWSQWKILEIDSFNAVNPKFAPVGEDWRSSYIQQSIQYSCHCECSNQHQTLPVSAKTWNIFIILQAQFKPCIFALWPLHWPGGCQRPSTASLTPSLRPGSSSVWPSKRLVRTSFHWRPCPGPSAGPTGTNCSQGRCSTWPPVWSPVLQFFRISYSSLGASECWPWREQILPCSSYRVENRRRKTTDQMREVNTGSSINYIIITCEEDIHLVTGLL